jgi:hypothetical protein
MTEQIQNDAGQPDETPAPPESSAGLDELRRENEELKAAARLRNARESMTTELERAGARSPELLFEAVTGELEFDTEGELLNAATLAAKLRAKFPEQFRVQRRAASIDAGAGSGARHRQLTADMLARMKPSEIAKLDWAEVRAVLAAEQ